MGAEHSFSVDRSVASGGLTQASRLYGPAQGDLWWFSTALSDPTVYTPDTAEGLQGLLERAGRLPISTLAVKVDGLFPGDPVVQQFLADADRRGIGVTVEFHDGSGLSIEDQWAREWLAAGVRGLDVTHSPDSLSLAGLVAEAGPDRFRTMLVSGADLDPLADRLREDWIEVTRSDAAMFEEWSTDASVRVLTDFYGLHESIGSVPAWEVTRFFPHSVLEPTAQVLTMCGLPGAITLDIGVADQVTLVRRALRYRREYGMGRASLGYAVSGDVVTLFVGSVEIYLNFGSLTTVRSPGRLLLTTGAQSDGDKLTLDTGSATWCTVSPRTR